MYDFSGDAGHHHRSQGKHMQIPIKRGPKLGLGSSGLSWAVLGSSGLNHFWKHFWLLGKLYSFGLWAKFNKEIISWTNV